ncbi:hypothetical protein GIB67_006979, partial [Kingdonia uniflora]
MFHARDQKEMDNVLCDELLLGILQRLPPSSSPAVSLVSKRWLHNYRISKTSISLRIPANNASFPYSLSQYPYLSSLSLTSDISSHCSKSQFFTGPVFLRIPSDNSSVSCFSYFLCKYPFLSSLSLVSDNAYRDCVVFNDLLYSVASSCLNLRHLRFFAGPVPPSALFSLPISRNLTSLNISSFALLPCYGMNSNLVRGSSSELSCEGTSDGVSSNSFKKCLHGIEELELRISRAIVDVVLLQLEHNCESLKSLLVYDGSSRGGFHHFFCRSIGKRNLRSLDLCLPLDLDKDHLFAIAVNFKDLMSLLLQNCYLITGKGLRTLGLSMSDILEELSLINCDVAKREPRLLTMLGQNLRVLKILDLELTETAMVSMSKNCIFLENVDINQCWGIGERGIEVLAVNFPRLRRIEADQGNLADVTRTRAMKKSIEVV